MSAKTILGVMIAGSVAVMLVPARHVDAPTTQATPAPLTRVRERPWLTREAAAQIAGPDGSLGPLFADVELGGPAPAAATRARIAAFARAHELDLDFEVVAGELVAIRFGVTFGGCCGYEGADTLARGLSRPRTQSCCDCPTDWVDDWTVALDDGVQLRGRVRVNRVEARWERTLTVAELLDRVDGVLGQPRARASQAAGDRWTELEPGQRYLLEVPYPFARPGELDAPANLAARDDLGMHVRVEHGQIAEVAFALREDDDPTEHGLLAILRARWGRPRSVDQEAMSYAWRTPGRRMTAKLDGTVTRIVIALGS